jgi:hypothetical protein
MKKVAYIAGGILIGFVLSTTAGAFADSVKSLVGKKVTGEYTVIVDGKKLADKGAVIDGKANVPVRGISEALGADIKVSGKTITVTTSDVEDSTKQAEVSTETSDTKYTGWSKERLQETISVIESNILKPRTEGRDRIAAEIENYKSMGMEPSTYSDRTDALNEYEEAIAKANADIAQAEAALAALK